MTFLSLLIPLALVTSFLIRKRIKLIFTGALCIIVLIWIFSDRKEFSFYISLSMVILSIPVFAFNLDKMFTLATLDMENRLSVLENSLKEQQARNYCLNDTIGILEKQSIAVSDLYEMAKDMSSSLHFQDVLNIFQSMLCKNFSFDKGFIVTLRHNPDELEIDKIYQICRSENKELKEIPFPGPAYYKILEYLYHRKESRYVAKNSNIAKQFDLLNSQGLAVCLFKVENKITGAVVLDGLGEENFDKLYIFSTQFSLELKKVTLYEQIEELATTDSLTGLYLRRQFTKLAEEELKRAAKYNLNLAFLMLDTDHFKNLNDTYGHLTGDYILKTIARILKTSLREIDLIGRYGGEEFSIMLPDTKIDGAKIVTERLLHSIRNYEFKAYDQKFKTTLSIGIANFPDNGGTLSELTEAADKALYAAKDKGRNCAVFYSQIPG